MASGDSLHVFLPGGSDPLTSLFAPPDLITAATGLRGVLLFDDTVAWSAIWSDVMNGALSAGGDLTVDIWGSMAAANTTDDLVLNVGIERMEVGVSLGAGGNDFASVQSVTVTVDDQADDLFKATVTFTSGAQMDSLAKNEPFRLEVTRDAPNGADGAVGDFQLSRVEVRET